MAFNIVLKRAEIVSGALYYATVTFYLTDGVTILPAVTVQSISIHKNDWAADPSGSKLAILTDLKDKAKAKKAEMEADLTLMLNARAAVKAALIADGVPATEE